MKDKDDKLIYESWRDRAAAEPEEDDPVRDGPGYDPDGNPIPDYNPDADSGWSSEGLEELEPHELVQFISESLPKFLQTHYDTESYDNVQKALVEAAYIINQNTQ